MKPFMKECYKCGTTVKSAKCNKQGVSLNCMRCPECGEEYFTSSELIKFDIKTGKKDLIRKFGKLGDSQMIRLPAKITRDFKIKPGDFGVFEEKPEGILIKPLHAKELA
jgi:hypothetical protein